MSKFNTAAGATAAVLSPITSETVPTGRTHEGGAGYARDTKSELFLLAVSNLVGEDTFYEKAGDRDARFRHLVRAAAVADPDWTARFLGWLRSEANMRSAPLVGGAEFVKARLDAAGSRPAGQHETAEPAGQWEGDNLSYATVTNRGVIASVLQRADEPGELLAYWTSTYGRAIPKPVKRGVADAVRRLYNERALLKYDSDSRGFRFGDVVDLVHPSPAAPWQGDLFAHALDRRHGRDNPIPESLTVLRNRANLMEVPVPERQRMVQSVPSMSDVLRAAGMTWEALAGWLQGPMDAAAWRAVIPTMGYMALLRNLRNFDEAGVPDEVALAVAGRLADPAQVARSRQFPFRFLSAYETAPSLRWGHALDQALQASVSNLPALAGRSLVLIDTSASMTQRTLSERSKVTPAKAAAVFGIALAAKGEQVDVHGFASGVFGNQLAKGASVIREVDRFLRRIGEVGHGTDIPGALRATYRGHDRVFIVSDMQTIGPGVDLLVPGNVPIYGFNLGGYQHGAYAAGSANRHEFGGLTDATFRMVPLLEAGRSATWPF